MITAQLEEQGDSPQLYAKRARIYQDNQHWQEAMSDFNKAAELDPDNVDYDLDRASLCYDAGEYQRSLDFVDLYLLRREGTAEALLIKAQSYLALEDYQRAAKSYESALSDAAGQFSPEYYVEFADTLTKTGDKRKALQVLQQGINQIGAISVFQVKAAELEVDLKLYDSALKRIDQILGQSQRKDIWLSRRADILASAGRDKEAQQVYQQAYSALQQLPQRLQNLQVSRELETALLARIDSQ
ncbi:MAG: tetratricopeptide repeat protein [Gammaproteobacteria bacterium]|nr:tetratricopeptide repeat protein [Gammaproteobacteria bacterium]